MIFALRPLKRNAKVQGTQAGLHAMVLRDVSESEIAPKKVTFVPNLARQDLLQRPLNPVHLFADDSDRLLVFRRVG